MLLGGMIFEPVHVVMRAEARQARMVVVEGELRALLVHGRDGDWRLEAAFGALAGGGGLQFTSLEAFRAWALRPSAAA